MAEARSDQGNAEGEPAPGLSDEEERLVRERQPSSAMVLHEIIRLQGDDELDRPIRSLIFSGFAAGVAISASVLSEAFLKMRLPEAGWTELVVSLGYTVGFVIVILGKMQLFTESTVTAVLPVATRPTFANAGRLLRLWSLVLVANLLGTLLVAVLMAKQVIIDREQLAVAVDISAAILKHGPGTTLLLSMPAGFLIASIAWMLPNARGSEFWVIVLITYVISIGGFSHVVAGAAEAWLLVLTGTTSLGTAVGGFILPALAGNIIGGTGLFAVVAHGQVHDELAGDR